MESGEGKIEPGVSIELNEAQIAARKRRNAAIGLCLAALVLVFYAASVVKIGPGMLRSAQEQGQSQ